MTTDDFQVNDADLAAAKAEVNAIVPPDYDELLGKVRVWKAAKMQPKPVRHPDRKLQTEIPIGDWDVTRNFSRINIQPFGENSLGRLRGWCFTDDDVFALYEEDGIKGGYLYSLSFGEQQPYLIHRMGRSTVSVGEVKRVLSDGRVVYLKDRKLLVSHPSNSKALDEGATVLYPVCPDDIRVMNDGKSIAFSQAVTLVTGKQEIRLHRTGGSDTIRFTKCQMWELVKGGVVLEIDGKIFYRPFGEERYHLLKLPPHLEWRGNSDIPGVMLRLKDESLMYVPIREAMTDKSYRELKEPVSLTGWALASLVTLLGLVFAVASAFGMGLLLLVIPAMVLFPIVAFFLMSLQGWLRSPGKRYRADGNSHQLDRGKMEISATQSEASLAPAAQVEVTLADVKEYIRSEVDSFEQRLSGKNGRLANVEARLVEEEKALRTDLIAGRETLKQPDMEGSVILKAAVAALEEQLEANRLNREKVSQCRAGVSAFVETKLKGFGRCFTEAEFAERVRNHGIVREGLQVAAQSSIAVTLAELRAESQRFVIETETLLGGIAAGISDGALPGADTDAGWRLRIAAESGAATADDAEAEAEVEAQAMTEADDRVSRLSV